MATTLTNLILSARQLAGDGPTSNLARNEDLNNEDIGNSVDGSNKVFSVINYPIAPGGVQMVNADGTVLSATANPADYTTNEGTGQLTLNTAPAQSLYVTYYYYLMDDAAWTEFITSGVQRLNLSSNNGVASDVTQIAEGLLPALKQYACGAWAMRIAAQTGLWYNQRLQERVEDRENISKKFAAISAQFYKQGDADKANYYSGSGTQLRPSFRVVQHIPSNFTPPR